MAPIQTGAYGCPGRELSSLSSESDVSCSVQHNTGFPVLLAHEFTEITNELRTSLLLAVVIGICLIGLATRSVFYTLAVAVPNAFPILLVELFIYLGSGEISITQVVALTLAFGIAIDNAVHVVNIVEAERAAGRGLSTCLRLAIAEVAPALAGSTLIICAATVVTFTSILPILPKETKN